MSNVSDTARWVAAYRAAESERDDALFTDHLADRLAGHHGRAIAASTVMPRLARNGWPVIARTKLIDDLIAKSLAAGCDRVINLAAGLDTRPYRLDLPADLLWIEVDLPGLVEEKTSLLDGETPNCKLIRRAADLLDSDARAAVLDEALDGAKNALVLTEGLLSYLLPDDVRNISQSLHRPEIRWWITDLISPGAKRMSERNIEKHLDNAAVQFTPGNGVRFFEPDGWQTVDSASVFKAAAKFDRLPFLMRLLAYLPEPGTPEKPGNTGWTGIVRFERA